MKRFIREVLLYLAPLAVLAAVALFPGFYTREFGSFDRTIALQRSHQTGTIGMGYNEQTPYYKMRNANYFQASVIALGTSRVMQFSGDYFLSSFYNCGGGVEGNYGEYKNFLKNLEYSPKLILLGLDPWVFNRNWNYNRDDYSDFSIPVTKTDRSISAILNNMYSDFIARKWDFTDLNNYPDNYGFNGRINGDGFQPDGSYCYASFYRDPVISNEFRFRDTMDRISNGTNRFEYGDHIDPDTLRQLEGLLSYCKEHTIQVIGFSPPFAPAVWQSMTTNGHFGYLSEIPSACSSLFEEYGYEYFDFSDVSSLNLTDDFFLDGFHGSDIVYGVITEKMSQNGILLAEYIDLPYLRDRLETRYNTWVFDKPPLNEQR